MPRKMFPDRQLNEFYQTRVFGLTTLGLGHTASTMLLPTLKLEKSPRPVSPQPPSPPAFMKIRPNRPKLLPALQSPPSSVKLPLKPRPPRTPSLHPNSPASAAGRQIRPIKPSPKLGRQSVSFELKPLVSCYIGEERGDCSFGNKYQQETGHPWHVKYLKPAEKIPYRVSISSSGLLLDSASRPLNTTVTSNFGGAAMFIMDSRGNLLVSTHEEDGKFQHSSLASGMPVAMAGEIRVKRGRITYISNSSGHYRPDRKQMVQCINALRKQGVSLRGVEVDLYGHRKFNLRA